MRKVLLIGIFLIVCLTNLSAQITPFALPPKWYFGHKAGMDFTGGAPVAMSGNLWDGTSYSNQEGATTECLPNKNVLYYSNSCVLANAANTNFGPSPIGTTGNSSTQGCLSIPNPANPNTSFFYITTDVDASGGSDCATPSRGVYYYPATTTPSLGAGVQLAPADQVGESIAVSSDNAGGYWIVAHHKTNGGSDLTYYAWHVSSTGVVNTTPVTSTGSAAHAAEWRPQASLKFNKCNNKIAFITRGAWEVYNWDSNPVTGGKLNGLIASGVIATPGTNGNGFGYGCEFSPDGNIFYYSDLSEGLYHVRLSTGVVTQLSNDGAGSFTGWGNLQIGPDDKIYVSNYYSPADTGPKYLAVISTPNSTTGAGCGFAKTGASAFPLALGASNYPSTQAGLITLGWHNPNLVITGSNVPSCESFSYTYNQYYGAAIPVLANSEEWDFGSGWVTGLGATPSYSFGSNATYPVKLRVKDQNCQVFYENTASIVVSCTAPVELVSFNGKPNNGNVTLDWKTAMELNNDYFDLQRSTDGVHFESVARVNGAGNSTQLLSYEYIDTKAEGNVVYYKLVQHDFDGKTQSSGIVVIKLDRNFAAPISVMPNPFSNTFVLTKFNLEPAEIYVYDLLGRVVDQKTTSETESKIELGASLVNGSYVIQYTTGTSSFTLRVEKQ